MVARPKAAEEVVEALEENVEALEDPDAVEELVEPPVAKKAPAKKAAAAKPVEVVAAEEEDAEVVVDSVTVSSDSSGSPADIRAWALGNNLEVTARGRIRADLREAYEADDPSKYLGLDAKPAPVKKAAAPKAAAAPGKKRGRPAGSKNVTLASSGGAVQVSTPATVTSAGPAVLVEEVDGKIFIKLGNKVYAAKQLFV